MKFEVQENYLTIYLPKDLDHHSAEEIKREADRLIERGHIRYVIFDFAGTEFCDSSENRSHYGKVQEGVYVWRRSLGGAYQRTDQKDTENVRSG